MKPPAKRSPIPRTRVFAAAVATLVALLASLFGLVGPAAAQASCQGRTATILARPGVVTYGTSRSDVIVGTSGSDEIRGRGGNDIICGGGGNDAIYGGRGRDRIELGAGDDFGRGGPGADSIAGASGSDRILGRGGPDVINGGGGNDTCRGGSGTDRLSSCNEPDLSTPSAPARPSVDSSLSSAEQRMANLVNDLRGRHGAGSLRVSVDLSDVARDWSGQLPDAFQHNPDVGGQIPDGWWSWGENIAYNSSVVDAFEALVDSPGHFRNMVDSGYTHLGVGVNVEGGRVYVTQVFATY